MSKTEDEINKLKAELAELRQAVRRPTPSTEADVAAWKDQIHQARERQMSQANNFTPEQLREMEAAAPASFMRDVVAKGGIRPPSADGISGQLTATHNSPGLAGTNGWQNPRPLTPPPGVAACDRLMDAADVRDRHELVMAEARRAAERKLAEEGK